MSLPSTHAPVGDDPALVLQADQLGKEYRLFDTPRARLKSLFSSRTAHRSHWALQEVSFSLRRGQCLGLVGDNGAGKSTLLKLLTGTVRPSQGRLQRVGRLTAILELGAGFHPDFTGRENLYFGGSLIGLEAEQLQALESDIIAFSELAHAIDRPVKTYSSGMVVRLAFALVTAVEPDVLIIDEALAVGDQHFQKKCVERIEAFRRNGCTILFCSHSLYHIRHLCDVSLWLDGGRMRAFGDTDTVLAGYEAHVREKALREQAPAAVASSAATDAEVVAALPAGKAGIVSCVLQGLDESVTPPRLRATDLVVEVTVRVEGDEAPSIGVMLEQVQGVGIDSVATHADGVRPRALGQGLWQVRLTIPELPLRSGEYVVSAYLFDAKGLVVYEEWPQCATFQWVYPSLTPGLVRLPHRWS